MAVTAVIGTGLTLTHSGSTFAILSIDGPSMARNSIEASKMSTTSYMDFLQSSLVNPGEVTVEVEWDGNLPLTAMTTSAGTFTITYSNSQIVTGSAFMTGFSPSAPLEDKLTATCTYQFSGAITSSS